MVSIKAGLRRDFKFFRLSLPQFHYVGGNKISSSAFRALTSDVSKSPKKSPLTTAFSSSCSLFRSRVYSRCAAVYCFEFPNNSADLMSLQNDSKSPPKLSKSPSSNLVAKKFSNWLMLLMALDVLCLLYIQDFRRFFLAQSGPLLMVLKQFIQKEVWKRSYLLADVPYSQMLSGLRSLPYSTNSVCFSCWLAKLSPMPERPNICF